MQALLRDCGIVRVELAANEAPAKLKRGHAG